MLVRDPETYKLLWVDHAKIEKIVVNEGKGKKPEAYFIRDLDLNLQNLNLTTMSQFNTRHQQHIKAVTCRSVVMQNTKVLQQQLHHHKQVDSKWK